MNSTVKGLVIREVNVGERDKIITLLCEQGAISASVPGARVLKSKKLAASGLLCYAEYSLSEKNGRHTVTQASVLDSFFELRSSLTKTAIGCYLAQLCAFVSRGQTEEGAMLSLVLNTLHLLCRSQKDERLIKGALELRLMTLLGFMPDLSCCRRCGKTQGGMWFFPEEGVLRCPACVPGGPCDISAPTLAAMRHVVGCDAAQVFSFQLGGEGLSQFARCSEELVLAALDTQFSTLDFYHSIQQ